MTETEQRHLRRAIELAAEARATGDMPFGSLLVGPDGDVLVEDRNTVVTGNDITAHPELFSESHLDPVHDGLVAALSRHASGVRTSDGLTIDVQGPGTRLALSELVETQLFAIGREALVNVQKHAGASAAHVRVEAQHGQVVVEVRDNGRGFNAATEHPGHFGLDSMRSRAAEIGGRVTIRSAPGLGTRVRVSVLAEPDRT